MRRHRRTHGGEDKRFECLLCDMKYFEKKFLIRHMKSAHKEEEKVEQREQPKGKLIKIEVESREVGEEYLETTIERILD